MAEPENAELAEPSTKLILIVDDDASLVSLLQTGLSSQGFSAETAANGEEALEKVRLRVPDLIITDLMMPGTGGYDLVRGLQGEDAKTPVIVATARQIDASMERMIRHESNVADFIRKPIRLAALYAKIHEILKTKPKAVVEPPRKNSW